MKTLLGRIGGMLAIGLFLSTGRAWAVVDADMGLTPQDKKAMAEAEASEARVNALADLLVKRGIAESCAADHVQVILEEGKSDVVKCWSKARDAYKIILDSERMQGSPFFIARVWGRVGFLPQKYLLVYKGGKTLQSGDGEVAPAEVSAALDRASLKLKQKAIEDVGNKIETEVFGSKK